MLPEIERRSKRRHEENIRLMREFLANNDI
jgi:hypothetical protein